jgi:hypothetical protein
MRLLLIAAFTFAAATAVADDDLVEASRKAKEKRKAGTKSRVITNEDVEQAKGVLIEGKAPAKPADPPGPTLAEQHAVRTAKRQELEARIAQLRVVSAEVHKTVIELERNYYEENDLDRRDAVIAARFAEAYEMWKKATSQLASLEKELQELTGASN